MKVQEKHEAKDGKHKIKLIMKNPLMKRAY